MKKQYHVSGDGTGVTYAVHEWIGPGIFDTKKVEVGIESLAKARQRLKELEDKDKCGQDGF